MAYYTGAGREDYLSAGGDPIDKVGTRAVADPAPGQMSLITDISRLQWGMVGNWGHPPIYTSIQVRDGGSSGSAGSWAKVANEFAILLTVPPRVDHVLPVLYGSGSIDVTIATPAPMSDSSSVRITALPGPDTYADITSAAGGQWALDDPWLQVAADQNEAGGWTTIEVGISITRADLLPTAEGSGGVLWGITWLWWPGTGKHNYGTWLVGDSAASIDVTY